MFKFDRFDKNETEKKESYEELSEKVKILEGRNSRLEDHIKDLREQIEALFKSREAEENNVKFLHEMLSSRDDLYTSLLESYNKLRDEDFEQKIKEIEEGRKEGEKMVEKWKVEDQEKRKREEE